MRQPMIVGNWKMHGSNIDNKARVDIIRQQLMQYTGVQTAICPPFVYIPQTLKLLENSNIKCGSQNVSEYTDGAYTGDVSATMLANIGCTFAIVGHSERRQYHHETNHQVAEKASIALQAGLVPIICVGESQQQRQTGKTLDVIREQLTGVTTLLDTDSIAKIIIAYEPVWAIGTGLTATPDQAQEVHLFIRQQLNKNVAAKVRLLYGGSVKPDNAASLFSQEDIDGALVGGASLIADDFIAIVKAAASI